MSALELVLGAFAVVLAAMAWILRRRLRAFQASHARDIGAQQSQHATALAAQAKRTAMLFDRMLDGIIILGPNGRIVLANRAAGELFAFPLPADDCTILEVTRHHEVGALVGRLEQELEVLNHELRLDRAGVAHFIEVNAVALRAADGSRDGAIVVFHDLTRVRQLEAMRQEFVANVSHELRTPLSLIKSAAETLIDGGKNDPVVTARFLDIIDKHSSRLTLLIEDLLLLSRFDSGRVELRLQSVGLREAVQEALDDAALSARSREVTLTNQVPAALMASADPERLRQVLANLIDNAVKYGRLAGQVTLRGRQLAPDRVELSVRDDGPGIPLAATARIFERFYRVDKARAREQGGTGLGLAIVKHVVQAHGGEVRVESVPGAGTEFFITLPAAPGAEPEPAGGASA